MDDRPAFININITDVLANYLSKNLGQRVTLYYAPGFREIDAIRTDDGSLYTEFDPRRMSSPSIMDWSFTLLLIPLFGFGFLLAFWTLCNAKRWQRIIKENPDSSRWCVLR